MKKKMTLLCVALLTFGSGITHAQNPNDSYTDYLENPGFEESFNVAKGRDGQGEEEIGGWTFTWQLQGWCNFLTATNEEQAKEGSSFLDCWSANVSSMDLHQTITGLPAGLYELSAFVRLSGADGVADKITNQHVYAIANNKEYISSSITEAGLGDAYEAWEKLTTKVIVFDESDEVRIGIRSTGTGSGSAGWFQADGFSLTYKSTLEEGIERELVLEELEKTRKMVNDYTNSEDMQELGGLLEELYSGFEITYDIDENTASTEEIEAEVERLKTIVEDAKAGVALYNTLASLLLECQELLDYGYPGVDEFNNVFNTTQEVVNNSDKSGYEDYEEAIKELEEARMAYYYSQDAAMDNPANYTFLIDGPSFWDPNCGLEYEELKEGNRGTWENIKSWKNASVGGGDYRTHHYGGRPCWNSWSNNFTSMDVYQELTGLANGYYAIKCYAMTPADCITDQHAYVKSSTGVAISPIMTNDYGWNEPEGWEELSTEMIAVVDGKLNIGFASTSGGDSKGWFCVTDFTLFYYGEGDINLTAILNKRIEEAKTLESSLKGDRKSLEGALAIAEKATTNEQIVAALDTINASMDIVKASNVAYEQFVEKNLAPAIEDADLLTGKSKEVMDDIILRTRAYLDSDIATSAKMTEVYAPALTNYKSYADALAKAEELDTTGAYESHVEELNSTIENQTAYLVNNIAGKETIDWYIQQLSNNILAVKAGILAQAAKAGSNYDFTGLIQNPDAAAETGWVIKKGTGNTNTGGGEHYSNDGSRRYFDSYNSGMGILNYTAYQEVNFLPNGNYTLKAAARSTCENGGAVMFVATGTNPTDTIQKSIMANGNVGGPIWQEAYDEDPESQMAMVNGGEGRGWSWLEITFDVKDHKASIGMSTDSLVTHIPFTGYWFSIVDFQLTMNSYADDNDENLGWITGIDETTTNESAQMIIRVADKKIFVTTATGEAVKDFKVYNITGTGVNTNTELSAGIYIVKAGRQVAKVIVK